MGVGEHTVYARARVDGTVSRVSTSTFTVVPDNVVQWQVVDRNSPADPDAWRDATGVEQWTHSLDTGDYRDGHNMLPARLVEDGTETARTGVRARFR